MIGLIHRPGSFSERWCEYLTKLGHDYCIIDPYEKDSIDKAKKCDFVLWHYLHHDSREMLFAPMFLDACDSVGVYTFPNSNTRAHYDNKLKQYLLLKANLYPVVDSLLFTSLSSGLAKWRVVKLPIVFKLKGGAGSRNVFLVRNRVRLLYLIYKSFVIGHSQFNGISYFLRTMNGFVRGSRSIVEVSKSFARLFLPPKISRSMAREKGYLYLQKFIPNNDGDIRVIVIGNRAIGIKRLNRAGDFRASGSGLIIYEQNVIPLKALQIAFKVSEEQGYPCMAYDFVLHNNEPLIVEMSYGFSPRAYDPCPGYWDRNLDFYNCNVRLEDWIIDSVVSEKN